MGAPLNRRRRALRRAQRKIVRVLADTQDVAAAQRHIDRAFRLWKQAGRPARRKTTR